MAGSAFVAVYVAMEGFITSRAVLWLVIQGVLIVSTHRPKAAAPPRCSSSKPRPDHIADVRQILTAAYKLENTLNPSDPYALKGKVVFYILNAAVQWCIGLW
jgi:hypothetical protein